ncbi:zinc finger domain-containing protein [Saccharopolyspora shandongensis]|uniref:zinc finger domain-containing protein n=1 Tax=Saccharopolyspora shandongensis TaxID=418495 RepID=UPI003F4DB206
MERFWIMSDGWRRVEAHDCPMSSCAAPGGSPCRTSKGRVAIQYHTARFRLVPALAPASAPRHARRTPHGEPSSEPKHQGYSLQISSTSTPSIFGDCTSGS